MIDPNHSAKFRIYYNQTIHPELMRLDRHRRRLLRLIVFSVLLSAGVLALLYLVGIFFLAMIVLLLWAFYVVFIASRIRKFILEFKPRVVGLILDFIDDRLLFGDFKYSAKKKIPLTEFQNSRIFGARPAVYEGEDYIEGRIGDVEFEMCELNVREFSRIRERLDQVFRGVFVRAKLYYPVKGAILVLPISKLPYLSESLRDFVGTGGQNLDKDIRHEDFKKNYAIYGSGGAVVSEFLPDELMDFILSYRQRIGEIYLSIFEKNCCVAISHEKDILEPKIFQSNVSFELVQEFYEEIYLLLHMVIALDVSH